MKFKRVLIPIFLLLPLGCSETWMITLHFNIDLLTMEEKTIQDTISYMIACDHYGWIKTGETDVSKISVNMYHYYKTFTEYENDKPEFGFYAFIQDSVILDTVLKFEEMNFVNTQDYSCEYIDTFYVSY